MDGCFSLYRRALAGKVHKLDHMREKVRKRGVFNYLQSEIVAKGIGTVIQTQRQQELAKVRKISHSSYV